MRLFQLLIIIIISLNTLPAIAGDGMQPSNLSVSDIKDHIHKERKVLRGKYKVNIVEQFINESNTEATRFGNNKKVLNLNGLSFSRADLRGVVFTTADMQKTNLSGANLQHSDLVHVDLTGANLRNTDFTKADLSNALFENVDIEGTIFNGANLFGAKFIKVKSPSREILENLKKRTKTYVNLEREKLPDYLEFNK